MLLNRPSDTPIAEPSTPSRTLSRRTFLQGAGAAAGLTIAFSSGRIAAQETEGTPVVGSPVSTPEANQAPQRPEPPTDVDSYLRVNEDGTVTLLTGKVEYGQGIQTGFAQLVAEELSVPFEQVQVVMGRTDEAPYDIGTFGSFSTRGTGPRIQQAAAAMREWLVELGAAELGREAAEVELRDGSVVAVGDETASVGFADLAAGKRAERPFDPEIGLKDPATFTVVGQRIPRLGLTDRVNGAGVYGIDATVDGMVYGKIVRPPAFGATLNSVDFSAAEGMPGVVGTFHDGNFAGLAAERLEQAQAAISMVRADWTLPETTTTHETIFDRLVETADEGQKIEDDNRPADQGDLVASLSEPLELTFRAPYVVHSPIEPRSALARVGPDQVEIWSSTQDPFGVRSRVAETLGRELESVVVMPQLAGGAFGAKIVPMAEIEAARLAQALDRPVKVIWDRIEEIRHGQYRPAMLVRIVTGLDGQGNVAAWQYDLYSAAYFPEGAAEPSFAAADWSADVREIYDVTASQTWWYQSQSPLPPYFWRVNGATTNTLAREVTMDVLAERAGLDPVTFRRNHMGNNERMQTVMDAAVRMAGWQPGVGSTGQGIGLALGYEGNTYVAEVARVEVNEESGAIRVLHVDVAIDCGLAVNPEAISHQVEGSVVMSTSSALMEAIRFENGRVLNGSFDDYPILRMRDFPTVSVEVSEDRTNPMGGVGEPAVAPLPAAVANAVYDAVGIRLADMPFTPDRVLAALQAR